MADLNSCSFTGRVTKDATVDTVGTKGTQITKFSIANNTGFGSYQKTNFFNVQIWGKAGAAVCEYLKKGKQVAVTGALEDSSWSDANGTRHQNWTLTANSVTLLADSAGSNQSPQTVESDEVIY